MNRREYLLTAGGLGLLPLAGCIDSSDSQSNDTAESDGDDSSEKPPSGSDDSSDTETEDGSPRAIKLGLLVPETGNLDTLGPSIRTTVELVGEQLENSTAFSVDLAAEDTGTDPDTAISAAAGLVDDGYPMIVGPLSSNVSLSVGREIAVPDETIQVAPGNRQPEYSALTGDWTFRTAAPNQLQGAALARIATEQLDATTAATITIGDRYGTTIAEEFASTFENTADGSVTNRETIGIDQSSYSDELSRVLDGEPDALLVAAFTQSGEQLLADFYSEFDRADMPLLVPDSLQKETLQKEVDADLTNIVGVTADYTGPGAGQFDNLYRANTGDAPNVSGFVRHTYDSAAVLVLANAAAGQNDPAAIRDELRAVTAPDGEEITPDALANGVELAAEGTAIQYRGASGEIQFDENGDLLSPDYQQWRFTGTGIDSVGTITL